MSVPTSNIKVGRYYAAGQRVRKILKIATKDGVKKVQYRSRGHKAGDAFGYPYWATIQAFSKAVDSVCSRYHDPVDHA
jgi:hypothetical protein